MARQGNAAPVIIKKVKKTSGGGHHGGAWKVAYADFVTAMMAFFLLMWLLNATTEKQRKGLADYFNPTLAVNRVSGGGDGAFNGDSVMTEESLVRQHTGARSTEQASEKADSSEEMDKLASGQDEDLMTSIERALLASSGESMTMRRLLRHVVTKVTDEGLVIELFDLPEAALFADESATPTESLRALATVIADVLATTENALAVSGHVRRYPQVLRDNPAWDLSSARSAAMRNLLIESGLPDSRFQRVAGFADRKPVTIDPSVIRNNRLEVILLRSDL